MPTTLHLQHDVHTRATPTERSMDIAVMFGLSLDGSTTHTIVPPIDLTLAPGQITFVTGTSGGGKSTLLRLINEALTDQHVINADRLPDLPNEALVDALAQPEAKVNAASSSATGCHGRSAPQSAVPSEGIGDRTHARPTAEADQPCHLPAASLQQVCHWLSLAGLNDAAVMLRKPDQLSEGQRHRLKLAQAMAVAERRPEPWSVLLIDEFGSTLDRPTAFALARCVRRWVAKSDVCLVCATTHDDLLEPLGPDVLVEVAPGGVCEVHRRSV